MRKGKNMNEFLESIRILCLSNTNSVIKSITLPTYMYSALCGQLASINLYNEDYTNFSDIVLNGIKIYFTNKLEMNIEFEKTAKNR